MRQLKREVERILLDGDMDNALQQLLQFPPRQIINPLLSLLYDMNEVLKWRSVSAIGKVVSHLALENIEACRNIMRRLIWNLNDESGGIGWGSPEAMGEIMANHPILANEYSRILMSYIDPNGNFLEHPMLQKGVLWALLRLSLANIDCVSSAVPFIKPYLLSDDAWSIGVAAWFCGNVKAFAVKPLLESLLNDSQTITIYQQGNFITTTIHQLSLKSIQSLHSNMSK
ncbi:MAG: hypothetical protein HQK77_09365 [Desulfobacterales bacterium]|nr:hypothetical protein [Desulfobacterales bacterium]